ncbi:MAG: hypothetical protein ACTHW2_07730 [Tissierella sp.]|uniref:hypothetical protein n=1 Tax=Tissierella sp. TaxID=41274 RepID=UPI003F9E2FE2
MKKSFIFKVISYILSTLLLITAVISNVYLFKGNIFSFKPSYLAVFCLIWSMYLSHITEDCDEEYNEDCKELNKAKKIISLPLFLYFLASFILLIIFNI